MKKIPSRSKMESFLKAHQNLHHHVNDWALNFYTSSGHRLTPYHDAIILLVNQVIPELERAYLYSTPNVINLNCGKLAVVLFMLGDKTNCERALIEEAPVIIYRLKKKYKRFCD